MIPMNDDIAGETIEEQAAEWCFKLADGPLVETERAEFEKWLEVDYRNRAAFDQMISVWHWTDAIAGMPGFLSLRAKALTAMEDAQEKEEVAPRRWRFFDFRNIAAVAMLVLTAIGSFWFFVDWPDEYATAVGQRKLVQLDDGSRVSLDASSKIAVSYSGDRRSIVLEQGRARFAVSKDPLRPFTVTAGDRTVVAVGTEFSVELLRDEMRVLLYEGAVEVVGPGKKQGSSIETNPNVEELQPGDELVANLHGGSAKIATIELDRSLAWERGRLDFVDEPLARAIERMNRYSDTPISIAEPSVGRHRINGVFDAGDTHTFLKGVTALYPVSVVKENGAISIIAAPERVSKNGAQKQ